MTWLVPTACIIAAWAMLRIMGGESQRQANELLVAARLQQKAEKTAKPGKSH